VSAAALPAPNRALAGIAITLLGVFVFAFSNAIAKLVMHHAPFGETLFARSAVALAMLVPFLKRDDFTSLRRDGEWTLHAVRCGFSAIEVGCYYWAITAIQLADASTIYLAGPIYVTAMSALFLREQVGWRRWTAVLVGFVGVVVALRPGGQVLGPHVLVAVAGSLLYAISLVAVRRQRAVSNTMLVVTQVAALNVFSWFTVPFGWVMPTPLEAGMLGFVGVVSTIGYLCVNRGLQLAPASVVAPFNYVSIVFAAILGFMLFGDVPASATLVGATIIVGAGLFIVLRERIVAPT
jgi:drug/metabolite transporter (DMT)-like permease